MYLLISITVILVVFGNAQRFDETRKLAEERQSRILLHSDGDLLDVLAKTQAAVTLLNTTLMNVLATTRTDIASMNSTINLQKDKIAKLEAGLQAEANRRCQTGTATFHHEECAKSQCSEIVTIGFNPPFSKAPLLMYALSVLDVAEDHNLRIAVTSVQVATNAATLRVNTWADTIIHMSRVRWMACPS